MEEQRPPPPSLPLQPEISLPVDAGGFRGDQVQEILTAKSGFSFCNPSFAEETLDGDGGKRVNRRRRMKRIKEAGGRTLVVGLGDEVQRRRRRCPLRSRLREKEKIIIGLEQSSGVSSLRMI